MFYENIGHQQQEKCEGPRHLICGPIVPDGERWELKLLSAKNNMDPNRYPVHRITPELSVCVYLPLQSSHVDPPGPPGTWVALSGDVDAPQFKPVKWEGYLNLPVGAQLGAWFRGAEMGDMVELNAIYDVEVCEGLDEEE